jgi:gliding motility-associated lipoprotein GldD
MKASGLKRTLIEDQQRRVFGIVYEIEGDAASQMQFFLTDSVNHFFRGSLYFYNSPNADSIAPVLNFLNDDIMRVAQTLQWK